MQDVENQAGVTVNAALDALGDRLASGTSGGYAWLIPDLHGNVVGQLNSSGSTVTDAFRYDAYGLTEGTVLAGSIPSPWRFQGKLLESTSGGRDLYDFEARSYSPDIGAFTSLDSVAGSATNPVTLDRYLYAGGNPETLIDPDGHVMLNCRIPELCGMGGGPGASQAQIAKYLAQKRQEAHRLWSRYGERPGDDQRTVAAALQGTRDQGWDTLSTADQQHIDNPILTGMMQARKDADLSGPKPGGMTQSCVWTWCFQVSATHHYAANTIIMIGDGADMNFLSVPQGSLIDPDLGEASVPARGNPADLAPANRGPVNELGDKNGCWSCGAPDPGTKSGNWVPDHQPPTALNPDGVPQRLLPQCLTCSQTQGGVVAQLLRLIQQLLDQPGIDGP